MRALCFFLSLLLVPVTLFLAAVSLLGLSASCISPEVFILPAFINLFLPVLMLINLVLLFYWLMQKSKWAIVPVISILLHFNYILAVFQVGFHSGHADEKNIRVATYNVGGFRSWEKKDTQTEIAEYMRNQKTDIVCFQEYKSTPRITAKTLSVLLGLPYYATNYLTRSKTADYGSAIFSRYPIVACRKISIPSETNDAMWADLKIGNDTVRIFICHLQTTSFSRNQKQLRRQLDDKHLNVHSLFSVFTELEQNFKLRAAQAEMIRQEIDSTHYPVIVCGDFNDTPLSYTYHTIKGKLKDSFRESGRGYGYTFRGIKKLLRIDFILYSPSLKGSQYRSPSVIWSDHKPVFTDLSLQSGIF